MTFQHPSGNTPATATGDYRDVSTDELAASIYRLEKANELTVSVVRLRLQRISERNHALADMRAEMQRRRYA